MKRNERLANSHAKEIFDNNTNEFEPYSESNYDRVLKSRGGKGRPKIGRRFNVTMPEELIEKLEEAGKVRGVGYQTMVRIICSEYIKDYLNK